MSVAFLPLNAGLPLRIGVRGQPPDRSPAIERQWQAACTTNPRLFDGAILAVRSIDPAGATIDASPDRFAHVVCPPPSQAVRTTILSVTGVIEAEKDAARCMLLAKRGSQTRSYPGMWEFAPAGGLHAVDAPATLSIDHVLRTLKAEMFEEVGITPTLLGARAIGAVTDARAASLDIIVRARIDGEAPSLKIDGEHAWECADARWVPIEELSTFFRSTEGGVIEPTLEIARYLGWISGA